jgi:hypothetical protein
MVIFNFFYKLINHFKITVFFFLLIITTALHAQEQQTVSPLSANKREEFIQKALVLRASQDYLGAIVQLDSILKYNAKDAAAMLFKGDLLMQAKQFKQASINLNKLLSLNYEPTLTKINLSYAMFMDHHPAKALNFAKEAFQEHPENTNAIVNYFNAMLWNSKTAQAKEFLGNQQKLLIAEQVLVLKARLNTSSGNYKNGLFYYDSLTTKFENKYYYQEYIDVLLGKRDFILADSLMNKYKASFSSNDINVYKDKTNAYKQQNVGTEFVYFNDIADNTRIENILFWQQNETKTYRLRLSAGNSLITSAQNERTTAQFAHIGITESWNKAWSGQTDLHLQLINPSAGENFSGLTGKQTLQYQPNDRQMVGLSVSSDILNFTASLLGKNIRNNAVGYVTHLMLNGKTGFYSQGSAGFLSDNNQNLQFFGSFYHLLRTQPTLKGGLNFSALHFKDNTVTNYFSPNKYLSTEVFADYTTSLPHLSKFYLQLQAAAGVQKIENNQWQSALRLQTDVGLRLKHVDAMLRYQTSNVASVAGTGYSFNWYTFRLVYKF